jgi:hypothetical protein
MATKVTAIGQYVRGLVNARPFGIASVTEFGAVSGGPDCTAAFNAALNSPSSCIVVPEGNYLITGPLVIPHNTGKWILGLGGAKAVQLSVFMNDPTRAVIEYTAPVPGDPNHRGCVLQNLHLIGNGSDCHGVYLQQVSYPLLENVLIEGFDGAALLLDKCQDGSFNNVALVDCGRTHGNPSVNADTDYSALHMISTIPGDNNNMLRFNDCQIENNRVSPYVTVHGTGAIGLWFDRIHAENATGQVRDFLRTTGGDIHFSGMALTPTFRQGFLFEGGGNITFSDCRQIISVVGPANVDGYIRMSNVWCGGPLSWTALHGNSFFVNCTIGNVTISYPAGGPTIFTACSLGNVSVDNNGFGDSGVRFFNCVMTGYTTAVTATDQWLVDCIVNGNLTAAAVSSRVENNQVTGTKTPNIVESSYIPYVKTIYAAAAPTGGAWSVGDKVWNSAPPLKGPVGWVCTAAGSPATWTPFGEFVVKGTAPPATGTWEVGDKVWHSAPVNTGNVGWVCITAGTPGTWRKFGQIYV